MKHLANKLNKIREKLQTEKRHFSLLNFKYAQKSRIGLLRSYISILMGRVIYEGDYRPLILGKNIDYHMEDGSAIVLTGKNKISPDADPLNQIYPSASSIGVFPHWNFMNPTIGRPTRIRLRKNAKLILAPNTSIYSGSYLGVWPNQTLSIGENTCIAQGAFINTRCSLNIGRNVLIAHETSIMDYDGHPVFSSIASNNLSQDETYGGAAKPIVIEDDVWIGFRATILKGCTIGEGSIIGAGACVRSDVPANSIVVGNPATIVKRDISWRKF